MARESTGNIYESEAGNLAQDRERMRDFNAPLHASIRAIGAVLPGQVLLDIGAGNNTGLRDYTQDQGGLYIPVDINLPPLQEQRNGQSVPIQADARLLPISNDSVDVAHARFVLMHFGSDDRAIIIDEAYRSVQAGGRALFIDYDWSTMDGSDAMNRLRDFTLAHVGFFNPIYGGDAAAEISSVVGEQHVTEEVTSPFLTDYQPAMRLRQGMIAGLAMQQADQTLFDEINRIFDLIETESQQEDAPGYKMPSMFAVTASKS